MPQRVVDADIKEIIETDLDTQPFIALASLVVDRHLASAGYTATELMEMERWLAAHYVYIRDPQLREAGADVTRMSFHVGRLGEGLTSTPYGQQVLVLDFQGILAQMGLKPASIRVD